MKKQLPIFLVLLLIVAVVVKKRYMVEMENETVQEIINEIEITQQEEKPIVQEVKPKVNLKEKHVEIIQQKTAKTKKIVEQDLSREEGVYDDGKKDGLWKYWDKKGIKEKEIIFEKGDDILWSFFAPNGNKTREGQMEDGKEEGVWTFYDENGIKERETEYKSGKEDGIYSPWYDNGQKQSKARNSLVENTTKVDITSDVDRALKLIERGFNLINDNTALEHKEGGYIEVSKRVTNYFNKQK